MEKQWWTVPSLPSYTADWCLSCRGYAFHDGKLYLSCLNNHCYIAYCDLQALIASCTQSSSAGSGGDGLWKILESSKFRLDIFFTSFQKQLLCLCSSSLYVECTRSLVAIGTNVDEEIPSVSSRMYVLPNGNLVMLCGGIERVFLCTASAKGAVMHV